MGLRAGVRKPGRPPGPHFLNFRPGGLRTRTEFSGFVGRRTQTEPAPGPHFLNFRPGGLRTRTEFSGFAGRRTQTEPAAGPPSPLFQARGSRKETEFVGFAGTCARTAPASGPGGGSAGHIGAPTGRVQMKSDAWSLVFTPHVSTPVPKLMHEHSFFCSMHHFLSLPPDIRPFICSAAAKRANQLMQEHYFSAFLHQFPDLPRRPGLEPGRVQVKSDAWHLVFPPHASTPVSKLMHEHPFFCSMHHFLIIAAGHPPFHLLSGGEAGESIDAGTLFFSVPASIS